MIEFQSIGMSNGTCFILKELNDVCNRNIIVDVGERKNISKCIKKIIGTPYVIDLLICTHWHKDHAGGISKILEDIDITVNNIWLPRYVIMNGNKWPTCAEIENSIIIYNSCKPPIKIKFFAYRGFLAMKKYKNNLLVFRDNVFPFVGLNCSVIEDGNETENYINDEYLNKSSLVFLYDNPDETKVLFAADSNFVGAKNAIKKEIVKSTLTTVPHHASKRNQRILIHMKNKSNSIFIRTPHPTITEVSNTYIKLDKKRKYCTKCNTAEKPKNIVFTYSNGKWATRCHSCSCK